MDCPNSAADARPGGHTLPGGGLGGDADRVLALLDEDVVHVPNLILEGLARLAAAGDGLEVDTPFEVENALRCPVGFHRSLDRHAEFAIGEIGEVGNPLRRIHDPCGQRSIEPHGRWFLAHLNQCSNECLDVVGCDGRCGSEWFECLTGYVDCR